MIILLKSVGFYQLLRLATIPFAEGIFSENSGSTPGGEPSAAEPDGAAKKGGKGSKVGGAVGMAAGAGMLYMAVSDMGDKLTPKTEDPSATLNNNHNQAQTIMDNSSQDIKGAIQRRAALEMQNWGSNWDKLETAVEKKITDQATLAGVKEALIQVKRIASVVEGAASAEDKAQVTADQLKKYKELQQLAESKSAEQLTELSNEQSNALSAIFEQDQNFWVQTKQQIEDQNQKLLAQFKKEEEEVEDTYKNNQKLSDKERADREGVMVNAAKNNQETWAKTKADQDKDDQALDNAAKAAADANNKLIDQADHSYNGASDLATASLKVIAAEQKKHLHEHMANIETMEKNNEQVMDTLRAASDKVGSTVTAGINSSTAKQKYYDELKVKKEKDAFYGDLDATDDDDDDDDDDVDDDDDDSKPKKHKTGKKRHHRSKDVDTDAYDFDADDRSKKRLKNHHHPEHHDDAYLEDLEKSLSVRGSFLANPSPDVDSIGTWGNDQPSFAPSALRTPLSPRKAAPAPSTSAPTSDPSKTDSSKPTRGPVREVSGKKPLLMGGITTLLIVLA